MVGGSRIYILAGNGKQGWECWECWDVRLCDSQRFTPIATAGPLRDVVERQKLEGYIQRYGDFEDLWMPLKVGYPWMSVWMQV
jgi:hypothetical protein